MKWLAACLALSPGWAWACPACATQSQGGMSRVLLLGGMILLPYAVVMTLRYVIRRLGAAEADPRNPSL